MPWTQVNGIPTPGPTQSMHSTHTGSAGPYAAAPSAGPAPLASRFSRSAGVVGASTGSAEYRSQLLGLGTSGGYTRSYLTNRLSGTAP